MLYFFILFLILASTALVYFSDVLDLFCANLFYQNGFYLKDNFWIEMIDVYMEYVICLLYATVLGLWILPKLNLPYVVQNKLSFITHKISIKTNQIIYLSLCFFGSCIALPYGCKIFFHRARPYQTDIYGGECSFTAAFEKSFCPIGDSFISGHTSFSLWLFALALMLPKKIRTIGVVLALSIVLFVACCRVLGGYHYMTDVSFAFLLVGSSILIIYRKIFVSASAFDQD